MVKVSIRDYMPPYTSWMQVELEEELCGSVELRNPDEAQGRINEQGYTESIKDDYMDTTPWSTPTSGN